MSTRQQMSLENKSFVPLLLISILSGLTGNGFGGWERTYGGPGWDRGYSVLETADSGYVIIGENYSYGGRGGVWLIRTDSQGDTIWTRTYNGSIGLAVISTQDGGYAITGEIWQQNGDAFLIKTDSAGNIIWTKTYGGTYLDYGRSLIQTADNGYLIVGYSESYNGGDVYLIKTDTNGNPLWTRSYGGNLCDVGYSAVETEDGRYVVAGTYAAGGQQVVYLIKTDANGDTIWTRTYNEGQFGCGVVKSEDDGYIITGEGESDILLIKTDRDGNVIWSKTYGGSNEECGESIARTEDGGYIIVGWSGYSYEASCDVYLVKTDADGDTIWTRIYGGVNDDRGFSVVQTLDKGYILAGYTDSYGAGGYDVYVIKTDSLGNVSLIKEVEISNLRSKMKNLEVYPNPFLEKTEIRYEIGNMSNYMSVYPIAHISHLPSISIKIYDATGRPVRDFSRLTVNSKRSTVIWDSTDESGRKLPAGVYFVRLESDDYKATEKVILLR